MSSVLVTAGLAHVRCQMVRLRLSLKSSLVGRSEIDMFFTKQATTQP